MAFDKCIDIEYANLVIGIFKKFREVIKSPTHKRTMLIIVGLILLAAIPLTVIISQQQQETRQRAAGSEACSTIDSIPTCATDFQVNNPCSSVNDKCKIGQAIYECKAPGGGPD